MRNSRNGFTFDTEPYPSPSPSAKAPRNVPQSAMNGRVFAVSRSPVLAWSGEPPPFADLPATAAAAISPADPYGRCWQAPVDAGSSYPYFGALYSNSLPSPAYRLQPGCMTNLGQFWPPTPPPDGCGRFDGSNLYFAPPVTPVLRHSENVSQNLRNSFQGLGHYSHLVETPKETPSNQRNFKQENHVSPSVSVPNMSICSSVAKSDNISTYCVVDSKLKPQDSISKSSKQEPHHSVSSGCESYSCVPDNRISSNSHPSKDKSCFSPPYSLKNNLFHNPSQDASINKPKSQSLGLENNCNASPLKNVYFSHFESENVNPLPSKSFSNKHYEGQYAYEHKNNTIDAVENKHLKLSHQTVPNNAYLAHNVYASSKKYDCHGSQDLCNVSPSYSTPRSERAADRLSMISEQSRQSNFYKIKPEKNNSHTDCKFQKLSSKRSPSVVHVPDYRSLKDVFNIPTSHVHPKIEPNDKYFLPSCTSATQSCMASNTYINSAPLLVGKDFTPDPRTSSGYHNMIFQNSCSLSKPWPLNGLPVMNHPDSYFRAPEAAKPPARGSAPPNLALHDGLISVAQTAPQDMDVLRNSGKLHPYLTSSIEPMRRVNHEEADDDVQVIAVQKKHNLCSSKHNSRKSDESRSSLSQSIVPNQVLYLKSEQDQESKFMSNAFSPLQNDQNRKSVLHIGSSSPIPIEKPLTSTNSIPAFNVQSKACDLTTSSGRQDIKASGKEDFRVSEVKPQILEKLEARLEHDTLGQNKLCDLASESLPNTMNDSSKNQYLAAKDADQDNASVLKISNQNDSNAKVSPIKIETGLEVKVTPGIVECKTFNESNVLCKSEEISENLSDVCTFNENHGLNLLLDTIEKVTSLKPLEQPEFKPFSPKLSNIELNESLSICTKSEPNNNYLSELSMCGIQTSNARGLDLLSAIAGQRFLTEFDGIKCEPEESSYIKSNYPEVKVEIQDLAPSGNAAAKGTGDPGTSSSPSSVFEMRDRLVELQKKYKQKQKELSRLKPKKMLACSYLRERQRKLSGCESLQSNEAVNDLSTCSNPESNVEVPSAEKPSSVSAEELSSHESRTKSGSFSPKPIVVKEEPRKSVKEHRSFKRKLRNSEMKSNLRSSHSEEKVLPSRPITRRSVKAISKSADDKSKSSDECLETPETLKKSNIKLEIVSKDSEAETVREDEQSSEKSKTYTLRKTMHSSKRIKTETSESVGPSCKTMPSKRKSDNPKKFMPSKQSKLSETIIAKHLRNRILFDTSGSVSDDDNQKDGGVPEELYDALMKCHLGEESKANAQKNCSSSIDKKDAPEIRLGLPDPGTLKPEHLIEKHRLLALEDGLMYAGCIKEVQGPDRYGVALDGQRGNRLHIFSREELLTQTFTESKPLSSELPEGTRVCAYWSQQYRCLYPGVVGKAPCPSADWSEPRVFVLFDDGDSGQIPTKNIRLIPAEVFPSEEHNQQSEASSLDSADGSKSKCTRGSKSRRLRSSRKHLRPKRRDAPVQGNDSKESSCTSINDSSCDDSCFDASSISPSQPSESNSSPHALHAKLEKRLRKHSKRKACSKTKLRETTQEKGKRHRRYKDKHKHHHHHHHHHRHHHHHHHHSRKRKHRRHNGCTSKNLSLSQDVQETNPAGSPSKRRRTQAEGGCVDHSTLADLPHTE